MTRRSCPLVLVVVLLASVLRAVASPVRAQAPAPPAWDTSYVLLLEVNPSYSAASDSATGAMMQAHIQYQLGLLADGRARQGGPLADATPTEEVGMTILAVRTMAEARAIAEADPAVRAGRFRVRVRTWTTPAKADR